MTNKIEAEEYVQHLVTPTEIINDVAGCVKKIQTSASPDMVDNCLCYLYGVKAGLSEQMFRNMYNVVSENKGVSMLGTDKRITMADKSEKTTLIIDGEILGYVIPLTFFKERGKYAHDEEVFIPLSEYMNEREYIRNAMRKEERLGGLYAMGEDLRGVPFLILPVE